MAELPEIYVKQTGGFCKGVYKTHPMDTVFAKTTKGVKLLGFVNHEPNACLRFVHFVRDAEVGDKIRDEVARQREELHGFSVRKEWVCPVDPRIVKAHLKGEKLRERPTTIVMPDGTPAGTVTETEPDSEIWEDDDE